jgi:hypothetical protein
MRDASDALVWGEFLSSAKAAAPFVLSNQVEASPNSRHFRRTSSTLSARLRNCAASSIELPAAMAALRSSVSVSVHSAPP